MGIINLNSLKMFLPNTNKKSNAKNNKVSVPLVLKRKRNRYSYELCKSFMKTNNKKKSETVNLEKTYKHNFRNLLTKEEVDTWSNTTKKQIESNIKKELCVELIGFDSD